jgi:hypothetical protein
MLQATLKTVSADDCQQISSDERSCSHLVVVTNKNVLKKCLTMLQHGFLLAIMGDKEVWPLEGSLITVAEYCCTGKKLILLRKVRHCGRQDVLLLCFFTSVYWTS